MEQTKGVRKGAWTHEEDNLLRACIHKYGEGKWHLVPERAGLNRCRKSCRLRWLNYLNPNIKRGSFSEDEVDLILRLHKLLKNRWSLIAARLPGRTANDVKNYWHTRLGKKVALDSNKKENLEKQEETTMKVHHEVIKPQPRTFSANHSSRLNRKHIVANHHGDVRVSDIPILASKEVNASRECDVGDGDCAPQPYLGDAPNTSMWLENLDEQAGDEKVSTWSLLSDQEVNSILEIPNVEDFNAGGPGSWDYYFDSKLCDFHSLWDL